MQGVQSQIACSSLGRLLSSRIKDSGHILVALESYLDGSHIGRSWTDGKYVTLAGFAAADAIWAGFDQQWSAILGNCAQRPKARYMHMTEAASGNGEFKLQNGWDHRKVSSLVFDLLMYLQTINKKQFRQFSCTVDLQAWEKLRRRGHKIDDPIAICNRFCAEPIIDWYGNHYPGIVHSIHYFFDRNEPFKGPFEKKWNVELNRRVHLPVQLLWSLVKSVTTTDMIYNPPLQAADMLAWASNRSLDPNPQRPFRALSGIMKQIIPSSWIVCDEAKLRQHYPL